MRRFKIFAANLILILPILFASAAIVNAVDVTSEVCKQAPSSPICKQATPDTNPVVDTINAAANIIAALTGIAAVIMIILGGFSYVTAGGNAEQATSARRRIVGALIGLVVVALAWAATRFITDRVLQ
jgi:hypothetical protein